ncbi:hypothetical protein AJ78_08824 [Emergomyces pasteurianus Ep9510]|uniref:Uncharacterized protein n=1 Tax=Emergomyces pasteurianus Ep9510 TaxID=1447872 RepID=A0A1J9PQ40_9EURO|nr:hypothetical protein AJ78_08824 [Emergomyces pasteurianus Ep9510]
MSTHNTEQIRSALHILSTAPEDIIQATIKALDKLLEKKEKIKELLEMRASQRVNLLKSLSDIRFHHIIAVEPRQKTDESIIRALFAYRSVCDELKTRNTSRVRELLENSIIAEKKNNGLISKYLQDKGLSNNFTGAIKTSIKFRVTKEWFDGAGVSLLFMNIYTIFRELRYSDLWIGTTAGLWKVVSREAEIYRVLQKAQCSAVPVFLGTIDLKLFLFLHGAGDIRHMLRSAKS